MNVSVRVIAGFMALLCAGPQTAFSLPGWETTTVAELSTIQGPLQIDSVGTNGYRLLINGVLIKELEGRGIDVAGSLLTDTHQVVLLALSTGGGSCTYRYRLLDLSTEQKPYLSREFGNCVFGPEYRLQGAAIEIAFPAVAPFGARTYSYDPVRRRLTPSE